MAAQDDKIKTLVINAKTSNKNSDLLRFLPLIEMIVRKEQNSRAKAIMSYDEMVNTGLLAVNKLIQSALSLKNTEYNSSYIAQSVKWAIKDELRARQTWYGVKTVTVLDPLLEDKPEVPDEISVVNSFEDARRAVFEIIMSVESMEEDLGFVPADPNSPEYLERLELLEMKVSLQKAITKLPENLRTVIEMRFYQNIGGNEAASKLGVTPSRISHMINEAIGKLKILMVAEGYQN